jgi:ammonia channel protein AmtB
MLYGLIAFVSLLIAIFGFYTFNSGSQTWALVVGIVAVIVTMISGVIFLSSRVNKKEDIHITE